MKYRSRLDIITDILESARAGTRKSKMMYEAYLSYSQLVGYLRYLQQNGLLAYEEGTQLYKLTEKGLRFLNTSGKLDELFTLGNGRNLLA